MGYLPDVNVWVALLDEALAASNQGCLATLDHRVSLNTVVGATSQNLLLL